MKANQRFILAMFVLGLLMTGPFLLTAAILYADLSALERVAIKQVLLPRLPLGIGMTAAGFFLGVQVLRHLFRQYVKGLGRMAEELRLMLAANRNFRISAEGPPEVGEVAQAANQLARQRDTLLTDVEQQIYRAKALAEEEKNRLAALVAQLAQGVVVCNSSGRILLYNQRARQELGSFAPTTAVGLGRSIYAILEQDRLTHALENIQQRTQRGHAESGFSFMVGSPAGQLMRVHMVLVFAAVQAGETQGGQRADDTHDSGYILTVENVTRRFEQENAHNQHLGMLTQRSRSALGAIRAAAQAQPGHADNETGATELQTVMHESSLLEQQIEQMLQTFSTASTTHWPLEDVLAADLLGATRRRIETRLALLTKTEEIDESLWICADSFALMQALSFLAGRLQEQYNLREIRLRLMREGQCACFDLMWSGQPMSSETVFNWQLEPMHEPTREPGQPLSGVNNSVASVTLREVLRRHRGEILYQREKNAFRAYFRITIPLAQPPAVTQQSAPAGAPMASRAQYYDFDLSGFHPPGIDLDSTLSALAYSVFDTETTGLDPSGGDEIIQIGAVRVFNGRVLGEEIIDQLVNPGIPVKPAGIPIHGVTDAMLKDQPTLAQVLPLFHAFCAETVLVAHNAAFDMRFLQMKEGSTGLAFTQPVLDTLLLSAVIHPHQESHSLESICTRLGIAVAGRHTALGDALVTAEVFLKMIPLLAGLGIMTLRQALQASRRTSFSGIKY